MLPVTIEEIIKEMLGLYWVQKARNIKSENFCDGDGETMLMNMEKNFKVTCYIYRKKGH